VITRRHLLAAVGPAAVVAGCGGGGERADPAARRRGSDIGFLNSAISLERATIAAYRLGEPLLRPPARRRARQIVEQEQEHVRVLVNGVRNLRGQPAAPKSVEAYRSGFPRLRDQHDVLRFAADLERLQLRKYGDGLPDLFRPDLRQLAASILAVEAEHLSVLLGIAGRPQTPDAFVTGTS
jgi:rubrerythrin